VLPGPMTEALPLDTSRSFRLHLTKGPPCPFWITQAKAFPPWNQTGATPLRPQRPAYGTSFIHPFEKETCP
jgi:hypothetical protein